MIIPIMISHSLFDFSGLNDIEILTKYNILKLFLYLFSKRSLLIRDNKNFIVSNSFESIKDIQDENIKTYLQRMLKNIVLNHSYVIDNINTLEGEIDQCCGIFITLLNSNKNYSGIYSIIQCSTSLSCNDCISQYCTNNNLINLNELENNSLFEEINQSNFIVSSDEYDINTFKEKFINSFVMHTKNLIIYDKQISSLNKNCSDIADNIKNNLKYWIRYFYSLNDELNLKIITTIKDRANQKQVKQKLKELIESIKNDIGIIHLTIEFSDINIHERYFCSDNMLFSCDKGIDMIKDEETLVDNLHLCIIEKKEEFKIKQELTKKNE